MNSKLILIVSVGIIVLVGGFFFLQQSPSGLQKETNGSSGNSKTVPNLSFQDYDGNPVSLADYKGTPIIVNSWAKWCPFCVDELPDFVTVQKEFGDRVVFIAVDRAEALSVAKGFTDELDITDELIFVVDPQDTFYRAIGGLSMPETIFVDADGVIQFHKRGVMSIGEIRQRTNDLAGVLN